MNLNDIQEEKDLITFGEAFFEASAKTKRRFEQDCLLNLAFVAGDQLVKINRQTGSLDRVRVEYAPDWVIHIVDNRILPVYRLLSSKLTKNKPLPSAKAHSREEKAIQASRAAVKLLGYHWNLLELDVKHTEVANWLAATGNCFYKQYWDPNAGDRVTDNQEMDLEAGLTEQGEPQYKKSDPAFKADFYLGDTAISIRNPFNCYPQPGKTKMREMRMFGDAEIMDINEIEEIYGKAVPAENDNKYVKVQNSLNSALDSGLFSGDNKPENIATVKELYILPCKRFPNGIVVRWANNVLLTAEEGCTEIPITHFGLIEVPGRFWYKGIVDDLIPIQRRWNQLLSKIEQHNDYYNDPPVIIDPKIINIDQWTNEPGLILEKLATGGEPPFILPVPGLDPAIFKELEILDAQFEIIPVLNKVSYGKDTPNATSGTAINFLQEKDNDVVRPLIEQIEAGYADVFRRDFKLCQDNYEEDRGFAVVGDDNKIEWIEFTQADLQTGLDVGVEPGSAMPRSKVAQQAQVMEMLNAGFFTDPQTGKPDFAKAMKYMEFGDIDDIYRDNALDTNQAQRENEKMKEGAEAMPEDWHNHQAHVYEHNRLRKTAEFEEFTPEIQALFAQHINIHIEFLNPPPAPAAAAPEEQIDPAELDEFMDSLPPQIMAKLKTLQPDQQKAAVIELFMKAKAGPPQEAAPPPMV